MRLPQRSDRPSSSSHMKQGAQQEAEHGADRGRGINIEDAHGHERPLSLDLWKTRPNSFRPDRLDCDFMRRIAGRGGDIRAHRMSARARSASAPKAAQARWQKPRRATAMAAFAKSWRRE